MLANFILKQILGFCWIPLLVHTPLEELEGEIPIVRRGEAMKSGFEHLTPVIYPGELLVMEKPLIWEALPMPWLSEAFFMAAEDALYKEAMESGNLLPTASLR